MLKTFCQDAQSERLDFGRRLFWRRSIRHNTWKLDDLCNPTAVVFLLNLDSKSHGFLNTP